MARKLGLRFSENMYGTCEFDCALGIQRRFVFHFDVESNDFLHSWRTGRAEATGWVSLEGVAERTSLIGSITMKPILDRFIRYEFAFQGDDGNHYRFAGEKAIRHLRPLSTWTTLPGTLFDEAGKPCGCCLLHFDQKEALPFAASFRLFLVDRVALEA